jgi:hypothetical protein
MFYTALRKLFSFASAGKPRPQRGRKKSLTRLAVEVLEDRRCRQLPFSRISEPKALREPVTP